MKIKARAVGCAGNYSDDYVALELVMDEKVFGLGNYTILRMPTFAYDQIQDHLGGKKEMLAFFDELAMRINHKWED